MKGRKRNDKRKIRDAISIMNILISRKLENKEKSLTRGNKDERKKIADKNNKETEIKRRKKR